MANISFSLNLSVPMGPISGLGSGPISGLGSGPSSGPGSEPISEPFLPPPPLDLRRSMSNRSPGQIAYDTATRFRKEVETMWQIEGETITIEEHSDYLSPRVGFSDTGPLPDSVPVPSEGISLTEADRPTRIRFSATVRVSFGSLESIHEIPLDTHEPELAAKRSKSSNIDDNDGSSTPSTF